jgi:hypothetical protein
MTPGGKQLIPVISRESFEVGDTFVYQRHVICIDDRKTAAGT